MNILLERTDDKHMLNASELCMILDQDMASVRIEERCIQRLKHSKSMVWMCGRRRERILVTMWVPEISKLTELKLLVDAVQSSKFITEKKSKELIAKLEKLCCKTDAAMLSKYVFIVNRSKTENETVYYNVDYIHTAIYENKENTF